MSTRTPLIVYVDVDETLIRNHGRARIPIPAVIRHVRTLYEQGAHLYCWSSGGAAYARESAGEVGLEDVFLAFLPKPMVMLDDQAVQTWRRLLQVHPNSADGQTVDDYRAGLGQTP
ncbi:DUF705 domain-containing protein [Deinococcus humi]|uniref:DUF705 domain-containing protein n=1 Tax=Deinococcus humi TaxID=662880 RepID=A0A7W8NGZ6_9DEIO|nr:DUF705 domain-containing protein [Deinococcus humi]MBB5363452.1 hypothetical protein [Deinococcus humi]GGO26442.1 hypothetical protein GCM10008949_17200 [Deinococcus humi]